MIKKERLWRHLEHLCVAIGPRLAGSPGGIAAGKYIFDHCSRFTQRVEIQEYPCPSWEHEATELRLSGADDGQDLLLPAFAQVFSESCDVDGRLACVQTRNELEFAPDLEGHILVLSGEVGSEINGDRNQVLLTAEERRALAVVVVDLGETVSTKLIRDPFIRVPAAAVPASAGPVLMQHEGATARLRIRARRYDSIGRNIIARHSGGVDGCIVVAAHYDSSAQSPGAADNATGTAVLLELVEAFAEGQDPDDAAPLLFVAYDAEEYGRHASPGGNLGSVCFVRAQRQIVDAAACIVEADTVGSAVSPLRLWVGPGWSDADLELFHTTVAENHGYEIESRDHAGCLELPGVPNVLFVNTWEKIPIHTREDSIDLVSPDEITRAAKAIYEVVDILRRR